MADDENTIHTPENDDSPTQEPFDEAADAIFDEAFGGVEDPTIEDSDDEDDSPSVELSDDDDDDEDSQPEAEAETEAESSDTDDDDDDGELSFEDAATALIANGFVPEEIRAMGNAAALKIAARLTAATEAEKSGSEPKESSTEDSSTGDPVPSSAVDAAMGVLSASNQGWSKAEQSDIANAIEAAIKAAGGGGDESIKSSMKEMRDSFGEIMAVQHATTNLAPIYPQLSEKNGMKALVAKAKELAASGAQFKDLRALTDAAALTLWGAEQNEAFKKSAKRSSGSKRLGSVTARSKPVDNTGGDAFDLAFEKAYNKAGG